MTQQTTKIKLKSGNYFYHLNKFNDVISTAMIISPVGEFLGGFAGPEADRKLIAFNGLEIVSSTQQTLAPTIETLKFSIYKEWIGFPAYQMIQNHGSFLLCDNIHGGHNAISEACDERAYYYDMVGLKLLYNSNLQCPLWAFIANHLSIFGREKFTVTFYKGNIETPEKDDSVYTYKTRYGEQSFKAPAAYLRLATRGNK